jgi:hypothetical protein
VNRYVADPSNWVDHCLLSCRPVLMGALLSLLACASPEVSRAHDEILEVRSRLRPGMTPEDVVSIFDEVQPKYLLRPRLSVVVIIAQAVPQGWAAKEWVLWVSLRQGRVAAVRIRTSDSPGERPREAPPDLLWSEEDGPTPLSHP